MVNGVVCVTPVRYIVLDNGLKALLISDYSGTAAPEDEDEEGDDEGEEEEEEEEEDDDDESGDETEEESGEDDEDDDNEAKKKRGNAEKQVLAWIYGRAELSEMPQWEGGGG